MVSVLIVQDIALGVMLGVMPVLEVLGSLLCPHRNRNRNRKPDADNVRDICTVFSTLTLTLTQTSII